MSDLKLEVGKSYFAGELWIEKIRGQIAQVYYEYGKGARFFSEEGHIYTENGLNLDSNKAINITSEVEEPELLRGQYSTLWYDSTTKEKIGAVDSNFRKLQLGRTYITSFGSVITLTEKLDDIGSGHLFVGSNEKFYFEDGRVTLYGKYERPMSVYDLTSQAVEYDPQILPYKTEESLPLHQDQEKEDDIFSLMQDIGLCLHTAKKLGIKLSISIES